MKKRVLSGLLAISIMLGGCGSFNGTSSDPVNSKEQDYSAANTSDEYQVDLSDDSVTETEAGSIEELLPLNVIDDKYRTTYEIFVYSFADSNGDGIGDLKGVTSKLDYIYDGDDATDTDLGCNQIWLTPIYPSPTYHKYDVADYTAIDPEFGSMEDFDELLQESHKRGIRIILDLVLNHSSVKHPWFVEASDYLKTHQDLDDLYEADGVTPLAGIKEECPYLYYYNFTRKQKTGYERVNGTEWFYEARFWSGMPDLNLDNDDVRNEISKVTGFWLDKGVDGFRLDAVIHYYTDNNEKNIEFMTWLNDTVKAQKEDAYIVAEAWTAMSTYASFYQSGIDSFFDFEFAGSEGMIASVARSKKSPLLYAKAVSDGEKEFGDYNANFIDAPFYTNHDMARSAGYFTGKGSQSKVKLAGALNLLMGGNAYVYYGEELGMKGSGKDENKRAPMQWASGSDETLESFMCSGPKDMDKFDMTYPGLDEQAKDPDSIYNYYKKAIRLRNTYPVISRGLTEPIEILSDDDIGAFVRYDTKFWADGSKKAISFNENDEFIGEDGSIKAVLDAYVDPVYGESALLILINNAEEAKEVDLSRWSGIGENPQLAYELDTDSDKVVLSGKSITIPAYGIAVLK